MIIILLFISLSYTHGSCPTDWQQRVYQGNMVCSTYEPENVTMMPIISNGYLGTLVSSDSIYVGGVYNGYLGQTPSHRARIPGTNSITITNSQLLASALDFEKATFYRRSIVENVTIEQKWYAHRMHKHLMVHSISIMNALQHNRVLLQLNLNSGAETTDFKMQTIIDGNVTVLHGVTLIPETKNSPTIEVAVVTTTVPENVTIDSDELYFLTVICTSLDCIDPLTQAHLDYKYFLDLKDQLEEEHMEAWEELWSSGVEVEGNLEYAAAVNVSLYEILSNIRVDWNYSISPGGIATNSYNGHVFWDCETWMYPSILLLHPDLAASLLQYRLDRLEPAQEKSEFLGFKGALFPWESAFTGAEACPDWAIEGIYEHHISGDISIAFRQFYYATHDLKWLRKSWNLVNQVGLLWESHVTYNKSEYMIYNVQPPDESAGVVNNSIYTNVVASLSLQWAMEAADILNLTAPIIWQQIVKNMYVPFNEVLQIHEEYDGYNGHIINQADVVLLQYPINWLMNATIALNDLLYWQNKTDPNGYFTGDSVAWIDQHNLNEAFTQFNKSFAHIKAPFMTWNEKLIGGHPHFITGAGGYLQNIIFGYGGLRIYKDYLYLNPVLPFNTTAIKLRKVLYLNEELNILFNNKTINLFCDNCNLLATDVKTEKHYLIKNGVIITLRPILIHK